MIRHGKRRYLVDVTQDTHLKEVCCLVAQALRIDHQSVLILHKGRKYDSHSNVLLSSLWNAKCSVEFLLQLGNNYWENVDKVAWIGREMGTLSAYLAEIPKRKKQLKLEFAGNSARLREIKSDVLLIGDSASHLNVLDKMYGLQLVELLDLLKTVQLELA